MEYNGETYLNWLSKAVYLDIGLLEEDLDEYFMQFQAGNISVVKSMLLKRILTPSIVSHINLVHNPTFMSSANICSDIVDLQQFLSEKIVYNDQFVYNIDYNELLKAKTLEYTKQFLLLSQKEKEIEVSANYYLIKSRVLEPLSINEILTHLSKARIVNQVHDVSSLITNLSVRLDILTSLRLSVETGESVILSLEAVSRLSSVDELTTYFKQFNNPTVKLLIDFINCE